jgi:cell division protein FtsZ
MGIGRASGENRASIAAQQAIESPLLEVSIDGARGVLYLVSGGEGVSMAELNEVGQVITASVNPEANIIMGASVRPELEDEIMVTVIATGFDSDYYSNDPAAQAIINPISEPEPEVNPAMEEPKEEPVQPVTTAPAAEAETAQPDTNNDDFTAPSTTNIWNSGVFSSNDDDNDVPAILRRHKRNRN